MTLETGAIMSCLNDLVAPSTKVSSVKECNQVTSTPHRVRPDFSNTLPSAPKRHFVPLESQRCSPQAELVYCQPKGSWASPEDLNIPQGSIDIPRQASPAVLI